MGILHSSFVMCERILKHFKININNSVCCHSENGQANKYYYYFIFCIQLVCQFAHLNECSHFITTNDKHGRTQLSNKDHVLWITVTDNMIKSTGYQSSQSSLSNYWTSFYRCVSKNLTKNKDYTFTLHKVKRSCRGGARSKNVLQMTQTA